MTELPRVSAVVNTLNEAHNIEFCLRSVRPWCDEVVVVDMLSDDNTQELARKYADVVLEHERVGFVEPARAKGIEATTGDWILVLDADEVVTPQLASWIRDFVDSDPPYDLVRLPRANVYLGRWLRSTNWYPGKPRLFRRGVITASADIHHGLNMAEGTRVALIPPDPGLSLWHFTRLSLSTLTTKTNHYTTIEADQANAAGRGDPHAWEPLASAVVPLAKYVARRGYRDGTAGLVYAFNQAYYKFLVQAKRWDQARAPQREARYDEWRTKIIDGYADWGTRTPGAAKVATNATDGRDALTSVANGARRSMRKIVKSHRAGR